MAICTLKGFPTLVLAKKKLYRCSQGHLQAYHALNIPCTIPIDIMLPQIGHKKSTYFIR